MPKFFATLILKITEFCKFCKRIQNPLHIIFIWISSFQSHPVTIIEMTGLLSAFPTISGKQCSRVVPAIKLRVHTEDVGDGELWPPTEDREFIESFEGKQRRRLLENMSKYGTEHVPTPWEDSCVRRTVREMMADGGGGPSNTNSPRFLWIFLNCTVFWIFDVEKWEFWSFWRRDSESQRQNLENWCQKSEFLTFKIGDSEFGCQDSESWASECWRQILRY